MCANEIQQMVAASNKQMEAASNNQSLAHAFTEVIGDQQLAAADAGDGGGGGGGGGPTGNNGIFGKGIFGGFVASNGELNRTTSVRTTSPNLYVKLHPAIGSTTNTAQSTKPLSVSPSQ